MEFKPAIPKPGSAESVLVNPPAPPQADGKTIIIGTPSTPPPPHVNRHVEAGVQVKKEYMWKLRRARGEKF